MTEEDLEAFLLKKDEGKKAAQGKGGLAGFAAHNSTTTTMTTTPNKSASANSNQTKALPNTGSSVEDALLKVMLSVPQSDFEKALHAFQKKRLTHTKAKLQEEVLNLDLILNLICHITF